MQYDLPGSLVEVDSKQLRESDPHQIAFHNFN